METLANEQAAAFLALSLDSELAGIAWLIARRSPHLDARQVKRAAELEARRETFGRLGRRAAKTVFRSRETFDERRHQRVDDRHQAADLLGDRIALADECAAELGELAEPLKEGWRIQEAAELIEVSRETAFRRLRVVRERHQAEAAELLGRNS